MSTFRAFQTGLAAGQQQRQVRDEQEARAEAAEAFKTGNFEGAVTSLGRVGLGNEADAYIRAGERKKEADRTKTYADAYNTGLKAGGPVAGAKSVMESAGGQGDFAMVKQMDEFIATSDDRTKKAFTQGMEFLGSTALDLKQLPPEARGPAAMEILQGSPFNNPQITGMIEKAAADGKLTDEELDAFAQQTMSAADRVKMSMDQQRIAETARHNKVMEARPQGGVTINMPGNVREGLDPVTNQPVFMGIDPKNPEAGFQTIPGGKPASTMMSAETKSKFLSMAPNAKQALDKLRTVFSAEDTPLEGMGAAAQVVSAIPGVGPIAARSLGGQAWQDFDQAWNTIELGVHIPAGSAVTPSEAGRFLKANKPALNDSAETIQTKLNNIERFYAGLEAGFNGDMAALDNLMKGGGLETPPAAQGLPPDLDAEEQAYVEQLRQQGRSDAEITAIINGQ